MTQLHESTTSLSRSSRTEFKNFGMTSLPNSILMAISDVQTATTIIRLAAQNIRNLGDNVHPEDATAINDMRSCGERLRFIAQTLRQSYDTIMREKITEPTTRFFNFDDDGNCEEVSEQDYRGTLTDEEYNDDETDN